MTMLLTLLCTTTSWAAFSPEAGKAYALKVKGTSLYLDIQTLGIHEPGNTTNSISLSTNPCVIYFTAGTTDNTKWTMKNVNGTYAMQRTSDKRTWNAVIGSTAYEWTIAETTEGNGLCTIARADGKFISMDNPTAGAPLYCDKNTGVQFELVEYSTIAKGLFTLKSPSGTYFSLTKSGNTAASFQETGTEFYIKPSGNTFFFETEDGKQHIGLNGGWNVSATENGYWTIGEVDNYGFAHITRAGATGNVYLGHNQNTNTGTGIFTNVNSNCNKWYISGSYDYPTTSNTSYTSGKLFYAGGCNKIKFTLTESGGFFKEGGKRLSIKNFKLYDSKGDAVELTADNFSGNNYKTYTNNDGFTIRTATWTDGTTEDDYFILDLSNIADLGGSFSFSYNTENGTMLAKAFKIDMWYDFVEYTCHLNAPEGETPAVTYNGKEISEGEIIIGKIDASLFEVTEISGYTWSVVIDEENKTITILFTAAETVNNPTAVTELADRIGGEGTADKFMFVLDPSLNSKNEVFVIGSEEEKILIKGTTISAITTGLGWYLNNYAHINIAWNSLNEKTAGGGAYADLGTLPVPEGEERRTCDAKYRYYLNYCTFGYSMTSWTWKRWQQEIDWMALHGINMPLQIVGLEEVWRKFLTMDDGKGGHKYGYTDTEAKAFVAGPAFTAWWGMNNLEGWGGTADGKHSGGTWAGAGGVQDDAWYTRQKNLAQQIVERQRELGMEPVLPGFSGMVPTNFKTKSGIATRGNGGNWAGNFVRPLILDVNNVTEEKFNEVTADYYTCLKEVMGESQYYSMDPFHEGGGAGTAKDYTMLYNAMEAAKPGSQWVIQQWQWSESQKLSLAAVPAGRLIVLDLFSDGSPAFDTYSGYAPQDAIFCAIPNFGGRSGLMGRLNNVTDNYFKFKEKYSSIKGIGAAPEAIEQTPVAYDLIFQLPWMGSKPDVAEWVSNYSIARYGKDNAVVKEAWELLRQGPLNYGADAIQGPIEDVWAARPNLIANYASFWGSTISKAHKGSAPGKTYTVERRQMLIDATHKLLSEKDNLALTEGSIHKSNYDYDLVEFGGAVMADYAHDLLLGIGTAKTAAGNSYETDATYIARRDAFLALIADVDEFKGTNLNFRLGKWTQEARDAAGEVVGAETATADWYEFNNARTILTTWSIPNTNLVDYSYRSWQGLMKDVYLRRWEYFFENGCPTDNNNLYGYFMWNWAHGMTHTPGETTVSTTPLKKGETGYSYSREPEGNTVEEATELLGKYIIPVKTNDGTHYAYRYLSNDLTGKMSVVAFAGAELDLSLYFGALENVTVSGGFLAADATSMTVTAKADAEGAYTGTITSTDGTAFTFDVVVNRALESNAYRISSTSGGEKRYIANSDATITFTTDAADNSTVWVRQSDSEGYKFVSALGTAALGWQAAAEEAQGYIVESGSSDGVVSLKNGNSYLALANEGLSSSSEKADWQFEPVDDKEVKFNCTIKSENKWATLYLPYAVTIPDGVKAYIIEKEGIDIENSKIELTEVSGTIPARTAVILNTNENAQGEEFTFALAEDVPAVNNLLCGTILHTFIDTEGYVLGKVDGKIGLYRGVSRSFYNNANKAYLPMAVLSQSQASVAFYGFNLDGATGIDDVIVESGNAKGIFDLQGRKLTEITKPGIYVIDGKKTFVK